MSGPYRFEDLLIAAALRPFSTETPWLSVSPVFWHRETEKFVWPLHVSEGRGEVHGFVTDRGAVEDQVNADEAVWLEDLLPLRRNFRLVTCLQRGFAYRNSRDLFDERSGAQRDKIVAALTCVAEGSEGTRLADAWDQAVLIDPWNIVAQVLRAGAAGQSDLLGWETQCLEDLQKCCAFVGDITLAHRHPLWSMLPLPVVRDKLFSRAVESYVQALASAPTALQEAVSAETQLKAAAISLLRRSRKLRVPHRLLVRALAGEPDSVDEIEQRYLVGEPHWNELLEQLRKGNEVDHLYMRSMARARTEDFVRFSRNLFTLELSADSTYASRRLAVWGDFRRRVAGMQLWKPGAPWQQGEWMAEEFRRRFSLYDAAIPSLTRLAETQTGVFVGATDFSEVPYDAAVVSPAGTPPCFFLDERDRPAGRTRLANRFRVAHELAHLLADRDQAERGHLCTTQAHGGLSISRDPIEQRANAFACYFLGPRESVKALAGDLRDSRSPHFVSVALEVRRHFGLTAVASAEHLANCIPSLREGGGRLSPKIREAVLSAAEEDVVEGFGEDEIVDPPDPLGFSGFPRMRGGRYQDLLWKNVRSGYVDDDAAAEVLGVPTEVMEMWVQARAD